MSLASSEDEKEEDDSENEVDNMEEEIEGRSSTNSGPPATLGTGVRYVTKSIQQNGSTSDSN